MTTESEQGFLRTAGGCYVGFKGCDKGVWNAVWQYVELVQSAPDKVTVVPRRQLTAREVEAIHARVNCWGCLLEDQPWTLVQGRAKPAKASEAASNVVPLQHPKQPLADSFEDARLRVGV